VKQTRSQKDTPTINFPARIAERALTLVLRGATRHYLTLQPVSGAVLPPPQPGREYTLYVHVPFCETLCPYCSFNRFIYHKEKAEHYFTSLRAEMRHVAELEYKFTSLYIGGGTPTIHIDELVKTIDLARQLFPLGEVSCETNPNHLVPEIVAKLENRVQRLSVGVQSFDDGLLKQMNRYNKFGSGAEILERIRYAAPHFLSLNVDMIFNFPSQTPEILRDDLHRIIESGAQQTTFYPLMSSRSVESSLLHSVGKANETREWGFYNIIRDELDGHFSPLSSWTFVRGKAGMIDEYIAKGNEYVGIGSGAFSYLNGILFVNTFSLVEYGKAIAERGCGVTALRRFSSIARERYDLMMALFGSGKKPRVFLRSLPGLWLEKLFLVVCRSFQGDELSRFGRYLSVVMMREFFSGVNNVRDIARLALNPEERACTLPEKFD
jgi:coproporphyrinogen III oxidase-like Fe-S oxidoreductase